MRVVRAARLEPAREFLQSEPLGADKWGLVFPNKEQKEQALPSLFQQRERRFDRVLNPVSVSPACGSYVQFSLAKQDQRSTGFAPCQGGSLEIPARLASRTGLWLL